MQIVRDDGIDVRGFRDKEHVVQRRDIEHTVCGVVDLRDRIRHAAIRQSGDDARYPGIERKLVLDGGEPVENGAQESTQEPIRFRHRRRHVLHCRTYPAVCSSSVSVRSSR